MAVERRRAIVQTLKAWGLLAAVMIPAAVVGSASFFIIAILQPPAYGRSNHYNPGDFAANLLLVIVLGLPLSVIFAFLATPFVPFRAWLVRGRFPYLRPGYLAVCLYGLLLLLLVYMNDRHFAGFWLWVGLYEIVALVATLLFTPLARRVELLDP